MQRRAAIMEAMDNEDWMRPTNDLRTLIGMVSMDLAVIEDSLDWILSDLVASPDSREFFRQQVLGAMMLRRKAELLRTYVKQHADLMPDPDGARTWLDQIVSANDLRNRLVHDLHEVNFEDGSIVRRRVSHRDGVTVDLAEYQQLAFTTSLLTGPAFDALFESIFHVDDGRGGENDEDDEDVFNPDLD
jgi:hypothetical protein